MLDRQWQRVAIKHQKNLIQFSWLIQEDQQSQRKDEAKKLPDPSLETTLPS